MIDYSRQKRGIMNDWKNRITVDPDVMVGKPVITGTRIPVELIVRLLGQGISEEVLLAEYPRLKSEDIRAALSYPFSFRSSRNM